MKKVKILQFFGMLSIALLLGACDPDPDPIQPLAIAMLEPTNNTETGFTANWSVNRSNISEVKIELSSSHDFISILREVVVPDPMLKSQSIDGLHGATKYYIRLIVTLDDGAFARSQGKSVVTRYQSEKAEVFTSDNVKIAGNLYYLNSNPEKSPAMLLMGHFSISNMWKGEDVFLDLVAQGYICYVFSNRGHGASGAWDIISITELNELEEFVGIYAKKDLEACYQYLRTHEKVDATKIGLMGGSMGANLSMMGNNWPGVKVSVGLTTSQLGLGDAGILSNVLLIASDLDCNQFACFEEQANLLYNSAEEPKKVIIIPGDFHGLDMLIEEDLHTVILEWINARMNDE